MSFALANKAYQQHANRSPAMNRLILTAALSIVISASAVAGANASWIVNFEYMTVEGVATTSGTPEGFNIRR